MYEKFVALDEACQILSRQGSELAVVKNPDYIFTEFDLYPLATKSPLPLNRLIAAVMDMDGTTTTTETLCIHSLEYMVRKITNRMSAESWPGLDAVRDYPHVIGNSTTRHVEYLVMTYRDCINEPAMKQAYLEAALWFLIQGKDRQRVEEVKTNLINLGCADLFRDKKIVTSKKITKELNTYLVKKYARKLLFSSDPVRVRAAIDIYYQRYHEILEAISKGKGETLARQLLGTTERHLIEPMPGIGEFLVLLKGWFGDEVGKMLPVFLEHLHKKSPQTPVGLDAGKLERRLRSLSRYFGRTPVKIAVVTSSILYEAHIVLTEVFRMLRCEVQEWPVSSRLKKKVQAQFENYRTFYDGCITATDSSEIRLKPHRDLYSLALHRLGINKNDFDKVIGFEDSESGTIAIRASGIGLCVAVPFSETSRHDFRAASHVLPGGVAEAVIAYNLFLPD